MKTLAEKGVLPALVNKSCLSFENIGFTVKQKKATKTILNGLSAVVKSGDVLAILGPSGAGKTTLMNVLTLQSFGGTATGKVELNNKPMKLGIFLAHCSVVTQQDFHWTFLTCREVLTYALELYDGTQPRNIVKVNQTLDQLGLTGCADTKVGNQFIRGLSGGQMRRLSIGVALLKSPTVIFMDEPTSGLDAAAAASIMQNIKDLATSANVVTICTIHQPSDAVFAGFDQVMLLSKGRCAYKGPASDVESYFARIGYKMPANLTPAEYMLTVVNADFVADEQVDKILDEWTKHEPDVTRENAPALSDTASKRTGFFSQLKTMMHRHGKLTFRDPLLYTGRMVAFVFMMCCFALVYYETRAREQGTLLYNLFLTMFHTGIPSSFGVMICYIFNAEFKAIKKEFMNGMVDPMPYLLSRVVMETPMMFVLGFFAISVSLFGIMDFNPKAFGEFLVFEGLVLYVYEALAQFLAVAFSNPLLGMMAFLQIWFASFLFSGVVVAEKNVIWPLRIFAFLSPQKWGLQALAYIGFKDNTYSGATLCDPVADAADPDCKFFAGQPNGFKCPTDLCYGRTGKQVLESLHFSFDSLSSKDTRGEDYLALVVLIIFFKLCYFVIFAIKIRKVTSVKDASAGHTTSEVAITVTESNNDVPLFTKVSNRQLIAPGSAPPSPIKQLKSGILKTQQSCLSFENIGFTVKQKKATKTILNGLSAVVKSGDVLAILGPSGAGKTTLMNVLTLQSFGGTATGKVELNNKPMKLGIFLAHCSVVTQQDFHWTFLTCREVLTYALELYGIPSNEGLDLIGVVLKQLGLEGCADTKVGNQFIRGLSNGQKRRLSIGVALLKSPTVIFMDEPTSGLDAAAAASVVDCIKDLATSANVVTICTIHQPSAVVFAGFDQVMLLSKGRCAYKGPASDVESYFARIGYKMPAKKNPAEYMLEVVNADFVADEQVDKILNEWTKNEQSSKAPANVSDLSAVATHSTSFCTQFTTLLRRHWTLTLRDPTLYSGRAVLNIIAMCFFALVYIDARDRTQSQIQYRFFIIIWCCNIPPNLALVVTYAQNSEFFAIKKETLNGMVRPSAYLLAKTAIELPMMFVLGFTSIAIPFYAMLDFEADNMHLMLLAMTILLWFFDCAAQLFAVQFKDPLLGMMSFMNLYFAAFLFSEFFVPQDLIIWPFKLFGYILPMKYATRAMIYAEFSGPKPYSGAAFCDPANRVTWGTAKACTQHPGQSQGFYCVDKNGVETDYTRGCFGVDSEQVLESIHANYRAITSSNTIAQDCGIMLAIGAAFKLFFIITFYMKSLKVTSIKDLGNTKSSIVYADVENTLQKG